MYIYIPSSAPFTIQPNFYPTLPSSVDLYKVDFFSLFLIKFYSTSFSILCLFFLNLSNFFWLFATTLFSKFLILLTSFWKLLKDKNPCFLTLYIYNLNKSNMRFWIRNSFLVTRIVPIIVFSLLSERHIFFLL